MVSVSLMCLVLLSLWGVRGEVAPNFDNCKMFFFREKPVSGLNIALLTPVEPNTQNLPNPEKCLSAYKAASPAYICQTYNNQYYFATLYDRARRIPLYSAYKMDMKAKPERKGSIVNYEPQLVHPELAQNMMNKSRCLREIQNYNKNDCTETEKKYKPNYKLNWSQAVDEDYSSSKGNYTRGHLNPAGHHQQDASQATMTFTNVAPQNPNINNDQWNKYEKNLKNNLTQGCREMYVVTGVVPNKDIVPSKEWLNNRVNVPSHYWNAFCCTDNKNKPLRSGGALCPNTADGQVTEYNTVAELQNVLINEMNFGNNFNIFFNRCQISKGSGSSYLLTLVLFIIFLLILYCCFAKRNTKKAN